MGMKVIELMVIIGSIRARADKSVGASFTTPELTNEEKSMLFELQGVNARMIIQPTDEVSLETHKVNTELDTKSQSQRIRNTLFVLWKQDNEGMDYETYYRNKTEKYIEHLKSKIKEDF